MSSNTASAGKARGKAGRKAAAAPQASGKWTTLDFAVVIGGGIAFGLIYALVFAPITTALYFHIGENRPVESLLNGIWMLGGFIPMAIVRKPGALLVGETLAGLVEVMIRACPLCAGTSMIVPIELNHQTRMFLNPVFFSGVLEGLGGEMVFCLSRYLRWDLVTFLIAGLGCGAFSWTSGIYVTNSYLFYPGNTMWWILLTSTIGIVVVAGAGSWAVGRLVRGNR